MKIEINTQASIKIIDSKVIYFDPFKVEEDKNDATYIFITHDHYDHYDEASIKKVISNDTIVVGPKCLESAIKKITNKFLIVEPNQEYELNDITFKTIPAYNINKPYHPKEKGYVGYLLTSDNIVYYVMGDTDVTSEIENLQADICFVPIGGTYTMDKDEAVVYINKLQPKRTIPIHYGSIVGDISLGQNFKKEINKEIEVNLLLK